MKLSHLIPAHFEASPEGYSFSGGFPIYSWEIIVVALAIVSLVVWLIARKKQ